MKIYYDCIGKYSSAKKYFELPAFLKDKLNLLIVIHLLTFAVYIIVKLDGWLDQPVNGETVKEFIRHFFALSSRAQDFLSQWSISIFTYQFIHLNWGELLLSISMLWLFGHILQNKLAQSRIILYYFILVTISAIVFNLSHLIFPIYSGPGGRMEGAFGGVLGIMTTTVFFYGKIKFHIFRNLYLQLWQIYALAILLSLEVVYKNNIAYILVYICSIYIGIRYAIALSEGRKQNAVS
jgi:membrane associated rhomboid family serine protease